MNGTRAKYARCRKRGTLEKQVAERTQSSEKKTEDNENERESGKGRMRKGKGKRRGHEQKEYRQLIRGSILVLAGNSHVEILVTNRVVLPRGLRRPLCAMRFTYTTFNE